MASNVVVVDTTARRITIKVNPETQLTDVLKQACEKWKLRSELYMLKYNNKAIDLSRTYRVAGLPSGAKLELVQSSRTPSVVNIALQLPQTEDNARLTEKFPSDTTLWQILRRFEAGVAGGSANQYNLTQRGIAQTAEGGTGAGRLFYEMPTVQVMSKQLGTFEELQKTLGQLGITSGSTLLRLSFKNSGRPLEDAMKQITEFFKEAQSVEISAALTADVAAAEASQPAPVTESQTAILPEVEATEFNTNPQIDAEPMSDVLPTTTEQTSLDTNSSVPQSSSDAAAERPVSESGPTRKVAVFSAPSAAVPQAATIPHNDNDFSHSVEQLKQHQSRLADLGKNRRLPSDAEIAAAEKTKADKLAALQKITVRVRMPDQMQIQSEFQRADTSADLWAFVQLALRHPDQEFALKYVDARGRHVPLNKTPAKRLIQDLGWTGDTSLYMTWGENVDPRARKEPSLNDDHYELARELKVNLPQPEPEPEENAQKGVAGIFSKVKKASNLSAEEKAAKMAKFMGFGKKK
ncbi:Glycerol-3-phosphate dehydrogenase [NAD(+)] [Venturia nashicola]|nr:Glycerol-3-phosphate dehydrogenase [NAD(+)] [Venturia nashicola]